MRLTHALSPLSLTPLLALLTALAWPTPAGAQAKPVAALTALYSFSAVAGGLNTDGANPSSIAIAPDGSLIGTAQAGGAKGEGVVFRLTAQDSFTTLHSFSALQGSKAANTDGAVPLGALALGDDGRFYGTTSAGGENGTGTVFAMTASGELNPIYSFSETMGSVTSNPEGAQPASALFQASDGNFYGAARAGGQGGTGTLFQISQAGRLKRLYSFDPSIDFTSNENGGQPSSPLVEAADGSFYGCAARNGPNASGTIYRITQSGDLSVVYAFSPLDGKGTNPEGASPTGLTLGPDGNFYGTASLGGKHSAGTIFQLTASGKLTTLYTFSGLKGKHHTNPDGAYPQGPLLLARDGNLYGVASAGGAGGTGTVFRITPAGDFEALCAFPETVGNTTNSDGANPTGALVQGKNGAIYGVAANGGPNGTGTVFEVAPTVK